MGTTASGKSAVALALASKLAGEIVNADSRQIYLGLDIGTAKPAAQDLERVSHHLYDFLDPEKPYRAGEYARAAAAVIEQILNRGRIAVLAGGTGLYLKSLLSGISKMPERDESIRKNLLAFVEKSGRKALHERLEKVDPGSAGKIPYRNIQRVVRALEVYEATGKPLSRHHAESPARPLPHAAELFGISWDREALKRRIRTRCLATAQAMIEETRALIGRAPPSAPAFQGLGYRSARQVVSGKMTPDEFLEDYVRETAQYAKRQMTWFRKMPGIRWLEAREPWDPQEAAERIQRLLV